jgi:enterochelin esterase-like enzyme
MKKYVRKNLVALCVWLAAIVLGVSLLQIDLVRQNIEIAWIQLTGRSWHLRGSTYTTFIWSPSLEQRRQIIVYLPPSYSSPDNLNKRFPVLYLLHGSPDPGYGWSRYGRAQEEVDRLITLEHYPPMIVILPDGNGQGSLGDSEFINAPAKQKNGKQGLKVGTYITKDVVNWVDTHFRTIATSRGRLIGGISTGGYGAANLGMQNPEEFGTIMSFSGYYRANPTGWARPVWGYHPTYAELRSQSPMDFVTANSSRWKDQIVIVGDGAGDRPYYRHDTNVFYNELKSDGIDVEKFQYPGRHSWDLWRSLLRTSLRTVRGRIPVSAALKS